ncbi:glycerophosphodiester phosphodiesterase family protein [Flavobacterium sp.]|uniref:glycerophosphodiester phosphodiesterase n=1 Tax=Flavobacterium sp. TaxID=239 RepID=UPI00261DAD0D|nr:glycerophosphodiester phosphodiesterase family protein [Flavobacterium sp.]
MLKIGHRGAKGYAAENTLTSFKKALALGVDGIELDIHLCKDNIPVVIHDEKVDRTTTEKGFIKDYSSFDLKKLEVPTLADVLDLINEKCFLNIEIKDKNATQYVLELLQIYTVDKHWNPNLFQISSFDWTVLEFCSSSNYAMQLGVLCEDNLDNAICFAKKINAYSINPYFKLLDSENVKEMHCNGFKIFPWTVNSEEDLTFVKSLQVDGIISDFPDKI